MPSASTSGATSGSDDTTGEPPGSICDPQPEALVFGLILDDIDAPWDHEEGDVQQACTIDAITGDPASGLRVTLACTTADGDRVPHSLELTAEPAVDIPLSVGMSVDYRRMAFVPWWADLYVTLRDAEGVLLLGYMSVGYPFDSCCGVEIDPTVFAPFTLSVANDVCELDCVEQGSTFIIDDCACQRRKALDLAVGDSTARVYDHGTGSLEALGATYDLRVGHAYYVAHEDGSGCHALDSPGGWHELLITRQP